MSQKSYLVYGPKACGKTRNANAIASALGLKNILDDWEPGMHAPAKDTLVLTNSEGPFAPFERRIMSYKDAMKRVRNEVAGGQQ
ncbi:hypothetical protein [Stutzerimonas stutzeri]|uniref:hypothetical protein n=1 Tax=Stutzerimonas stutzeri TaxID=316 RepID=UPI001C2EC36C|nr:hypothetical protein [Stutzerimonas stutzeri]